MDKKKKAAIFQIDVFCCILFGTLTVWTGFIVFLLLFTVFIIIGFCIAVSELEPRKRENLRNMGDQHARN